MKNTNYSYQTSLPPYREDAEGKQLKKQQILAEITRLGGVACLKQLETALHIPQSTCAGRVNDLIQEGKVIYDGLIEFFGRKRKKIVIIQAKVIPITQLPNSPNTNLPNHPTIGQQELKFG